MTESKHLTCIYVRLAGSVVLLILIAFILGLHTIMYTGSLILTR